MKPKFKTPYCHMLENRTKKEQIKIRQQIVKYAQRYGNKPAARYFCCSRSWRT